MENHTKVSFRGSRVTKPLYTTQNIKYHVFLLLVGSTHVGSATASFNDLITVAQENSYNQTADALLEDQPQPPLDLVTVFPRVRTHKPKNRTGLGHWFCL